MPRQTLDQLRSELAAVDAEIAGHPLSSEAVKTAHAIVEAQGDKSRDAVEKELAEGNLPSLEELGRIQAASTLSWWRLHRERNKLLKMIERLGG